MDLYTLLASSHSKEVAQSIADSVISCKVEIEVLFEIMYTEGTIMCQRAAWPLTLISEQRQDLMHRHIPDMLKALDSPSHDGIPRNIFRIWQSIDFPDNIIGEVYETAFHWLSERQNAIAIRVFAMTVCVNIADRFPALAEELIPVIEDQMEVGSAGFRNRGAKELKRLRMLKR